MNKKGKSRKGATLVELVIVLAVLAIAAGMVVSFSSMMHGAQVISNARYEAVQEIRIAESLIENYIISNANSDANNMPTKEGDELSFGSDDNKVKFHGGVLIINNDSEETNMEFEKIKSISFETVKKNDDILYFCTIKYSIADTENGTETYIFCVNPYAGER